MASKAFQNATGERCPIFVQRDAESRELVEREVRDNGGTVSSTPDAAVVVVILDRTTVLGSELVVEYAGANDKAVVTRDWVTASIQQGQILGPPEFGGHKVRHHTVQSFFGQRQVEERNVAPVPAKEDSVNTVKPAESPASEPPGINHSCSPPPTQDLDIIELDAPPPPNKRLFPRPIPLRIHAPASVEGEPGRLSPPPTRGTNTLPSNPDGGKEDRGIAVEVRKRNHLGKARQPDVLQGLRPRKKWSRGWSTKRRVNGGHNQRPALNTSPRGNTKSTVDPSSSDVEIIIRDSDTAPSASFSGTNPQIGNRLSEARQDDVPMHDRDLGSESHPPPEAPPRHDEITNLGYRFAKTDVDYLVRHLTWGVNRRMTLPEIYAEAAKRAMQRLSVITFAKTRSILGIARSRRDKPDGPGSHYPSIDKKRMEDKHSLAFFQVSLGFEDYLDFDEIEDADCFDDFPDIPAKGSDVVGDRNTNVDGPRASNNPNHPEHRQAGDSKEEDSTLGSSKGKGKEPDALSDAMVQAMIKTLSENSDALYRTNNSEKRRKLWEAFAKSNPNYSAQAYMGYHKANYKELELAAKRLNKPMPTSNSDTVDQIDIAPAVQGTVPRKGALKTPKRPIGEDQRSNRVSKKARFSLKDSSTSLSELASDPDLSLPEI
ncbi:hypothetical protein FRC01_008231 [Tulasnella sp. 417]|nr:hypothetical protein FRC01_008231 [Tulasnella sp. 417]